MLLFRDELIDEAIFNQAFVCDITKCKGECCVSGEHGAPLQPHEVEDLERAYDQYKDFLTPQGREAIAKQGHYVYTPSDKTINTPLINNQACAYIQYQGDTAVCGIELAYRQGKTDIQKPISCHLYPIRVSTVGALSVLNYDQWDICSPACILGQSLQMPLYRFLKEPLIRAFGLEFYDLLDQYYISHYSNIE